LSEDVVNYSMPGPFSAWIWNSRAICHNQHSASRKSPAEGVGLA